MADSTKNAAKAKEKDKKISFWSGLKREWNKIIWPTKEDIAKETGLVVVISLLMGIIITVIDNGALRVIDWLLSL